MQNKKSSLIKDALALCIIAFVAAITLGFVYEITKGPIADQEAKIKAAAYKAVYEQAALVDDKNEELNNKVASAEEFLTANGFNESSINEACIAKDASGAAIGYVMTVTSHAGYGGDIKFSMGVKPDGTLTKVEILAISETAGLGMRATEDEFKGQFTEKKVDAFTVVKGSAASDSEISAISGATVTSDAVTNTVNAGLAFANELLKDGIGGVAHE